jgi:hypothetical protein
MKKVWGSLLFLGLQSFKRVLLLQTMGLRSMSISTSKGIKKTAALPQWLHEANLKLEPKKKLPRFSKKGVFEMFKRRGVK